MFCLTRQDSMPLIYTYLICCQVITFVMTGYIVFERYSHTMGKRQQSHRYKRRPQECTISGRIVVCLLRRLELPLESKTVLLNPLVDVAIHNSSCAFVYLSRNNLQGTAASTHTVKNQDACAFCYFTS